MTRRLVALLLAAAGCAGASSSAAERPAPVRDHVQVGDWRGGIAREVHLTDETVRRSIPIAGDRALALLPAVFQDLGLAIKVVDPQAKLVRGELTRSRRPFGGRMYSQLLDCGSTAAGPNAARYAINLTVQSQVLAVSDSGTELGTVVQAVAIPDATGGNPVRCVPNDVIAEIVSERLAKAAARKG